MIYVMLEEQIKEIVRRVLRTRIRVDKQGTPMRDPAADQLLYPMAENVDAPGVAVRIAVSHGDIDQEVLFFPFCHAEDMINHLHASFNG